MPIHNGYTQINNTLLLALLELPKPQRLVFGCLKVNSDYTTHLSDSLCLKDIAKQTGLKRQNISNALIALEKKGWIAKIERKGYTYKWELSIVKLTNEEVNAFLHPSETDTQTELEFEPQPERQPKELLAERFQLEKVNGKSVKMLTLGPRMYRFNAGISDFEIRALQTHPCLLYTSPSPRDS